MALFISGKLAGLIYQIKTVTINNLFNKVKYFYHYISFVIIFWKYYSYEML